MTKLPRWWWVSMALWPITGIPLIAYSTVFFDNITPLLRFRPEGWSLAAWIGAIFLVYHPIILLPFALMSAVFRRLKLHAQD